MVSEHCLRSYTSYPTILSHKKWSLLVTHNFPYFSQYGFQGVPGGTWRGVDTAKGVGTPKGVGVNPLIPLGDPKPPPPMAVFLGF